MNHLERIKALKEIKYYPHWDSKEQKAKYKLLGSCDTCRYNRTEWSEWSRVAYEGCFHMNRVKEGFFLMYDDAEIKWERGLEKDGHYNTFGDKIKADYHVDRVCKWYEKKHI